MTSAGAKSIKLANPDTPMVFIINILGAPLIATGDLPHMGRNVARRTLCLSGLNWVAECVS
jgi:hypothetical protein